MDATRAYRFYAEQEASARGAWVIYGKMPKGDDFEVDTAANEQEAEAKVSGYRINLILKHSTSVRAFVNATRASFPEKGESDAKYMEKIVDTALEVERLVYARSLRWEQSLKRDDVLYAASRSVGEAALTGNLDVDKIAETIVDYALVPDVLPDNVSQFIAVGVAKNRFGNRDAVFLQKFINAISEVTEREFNDASVAENAYASAIEETFFRNMLFSERVRGDKLASTAETFVRNFHDELSAELNTSTPKI